MRIHGTYIFALSALFAFCLQESGAAEVQTASAGAGGAYYCPPGAKFCPAPGTDNTVFLDTHFGVDAQTGQVTKYTGTTHPDDVYNPKPAGETVLYTAPPISVENRFVPYPGAPQTNMAVTTNVVYNPPPQAAPEYARAEGYGVSQARPTRRADAASEVAHTQASRSDGRELALASKKVPWWKGGWWRDGGEPEAAPAKASLSDADLVTEGDRVPWWKGGMWRNRKQSEPDRGSSSGSSSGGPAPLRASDDMWDDDDYTGYNPDGSFGRQGGGDPYAAPNFGGQQSYGDPYSNPYAAPQQSYGDPYSQPYAGQTGGYVSDPYPMPNSPAPTSPYPPGYVYPGTDLSYDSTFQGGYPAQQGNVYSDPYASAPMNAYDSGYSMPAPPAAPVSGGPVETFSSPAFENAVRLVKESRFSEAKGLLSDETSRNPNNAAAWRWLGDCHYNLLELRDAINCYQRALDRDPNDYYALRGQGFSYLHYGHEFWRQMQEEVARGQKELAAETFAKAHDNYKKSLELLGLCLRRAPNDGEAIYGEAMAAEGASRKLYSNAISYLKLNDQRERAELFAENCLTVINKGVERAKERARMYPGESGPRALLGGLYLRKAILYNQLGKKDLALIEVKNSHDVQQSILDEIDKNNATAIKGVREAENYWNEWGGGNRNL